MIPHLFRMRAAAVLFAALIGLSCKSLAAVSTNSTCELNSAGTFSGTDSEKSFVIASLSKIFTTQWALQVIGFDYRYETVVYVDAVSATTVNVHISGGGDPTWGRERLHHLVSELQRMGVKKIASLTFDENFILSWRAKAAVIKDVKYYYDFTDLAGAETEVPTGMDILKSLKAHFVPRKNEYAATVAKAALAGVEMVPAPKLSAPAKIAYMAASSFQPSPTARPLKLLSLPLYQILKLMNVTSNNFLADIVFDQLGGPSAFRDFIAQSPLAPYLNALQMENGSGYPLINGEKKFYNRASCASVVASLAWIDNHLLQHGLGLQYVFPIAGTDPSTLDKYELPGDLMVAKTGTVNPTIAMAGMVKTTQGSLYFTQLIKTDSSQDWTQARALIKKYLLGLVDTQAVALQTPPTLPLFWAEGSGTANLAAP